MSAWNPVRGATPAPSTSTSVRKRENRPAAPILDLGHPHLLNRVDDVARHWDVVEFLRHLAALGVSPVEEFQHFGGRHRIARLLVHEDEGGAGHRPGVSTGFVGENDAE